MFMITKEMWEDIFIDNEQSKAYFDLCSVDSTEEGVEKHHILPKSIFPQYAKEKWNLVKLSYADHYKAHEILPFICLLDIHRSPMLKAWNQMCHKGSNREFVSMEMYEYLRTSLSNSMKGRKLPREVVDKILLARKLSGGNTGFRHSEESKAKMSEKQKGKQPRLGTKHSEESKKKMSEARKNVVISDITRARKSASMQGKNVGKTRTPEQKARISAAVIGKVNYTPELRKKISDRTKGENNPNYGVPCSEEKRKKISDAHKARFTKAKP